MLFIPTWTKKVFHGETVQETAICINLHKVDITVFVTKIFDQALYSLLFLRINVIFKNKSDRKDFLPHKKSNPRPWHQPQPFGKTHVSYISILVI